MKSHGAKVITLANSREKNWEMNVNIVIWYIPMLRSMTLRINLILFKGFKIKSWFFSSCFGKQEHLSNWTLLVVHTSLLQSLINLFICTIHNIIDPVGQLQMFFFIFWQYCFGQNGELKAPFWSTRSAVDLCVMRYSFSEKILMDGHWGKQFSKTNFLSHWIRCRRGLTTLEKSKSFLPN